jgi:pyroglutamyl-peptidase
MSKVIVTGFQPFDRYLYNPSWQVAQTLHANRSEIVIKELTVDFLVAHDELTDLLESTPCDMLLMIGLADVGLIRLETAARKPLVFANIEGPDLLHGSWNWDKNLAALRDQNVNTVLSSDAGRYVCESTYWSGLNFKLKNHYPQNIAFLHVPMLDEHWTLEKITLAARLSLDAQEENV